jgi:transcriptional regulator with XRE-family HTH domain
MANGLKQLIGTRLQAARRQRGLTQEELAFKINKTAESISNIERSIQLPSIETLADLARELGIRWLNS